MRTLVITPKLPYPANGADEQDRLLGIQFLDKENMCLAENIEEIVSAIKALLSIKERVRISKNVRVFAEQHFSHKKFLDIIQNMFSPKV